MIPLRAKEKRTRMSPGTKTVLWWGRFDPDYSRNRVLRQAYAALGWQIVDFHPLVSPFGDVEARLRQPSRADLVHVPCFRQRDIAAATRYARRQGLPLLIDPLISAYDKQLFERGKFPESSTRAGWLLRHEQRLFQSGDIVLADTPEHARFFAETLGVDPARLHVVYVGAEESLFTPAAPHAPNSPIEVLFYGSFIPLQGPQVIVEAARIYQGPPVRWVLLGSGPLLSECQKLAHGLVNVTFEGWLPYALLPERIHHADILLGVFGATPKAQRVIPNKVFQALACGKPLVTCNAPAYPAELLARRDGGIAWVPAGNATVLADAVAALASLPKQLGELGASARRSYERHFSAAAVIEQLRMALTASD
jgi:glycosyltransferase involved in cell wall biosynthesis